MSGEWQPIETAPKDGDPYLFIDADGRMLVGWWFVNRWNLVTQDGEPIVIWTLTHWMPLPQPPQKGEE